MRRKQLELKTNRLLIHAFSLISICVLIACSSSQVYSNNKLEVIDVADIDLLEGTISERPWELYLHREMVIKGFVLGNRKVINLNIDDARQASFSNCIDLIADRKIGFLNSKKVKKKKIRGRFEVYPFLRDGVYLKAGKQELAPKCQYSYETNSYLYFRPSALMK